jgi:hypothetical protein
MLILKAAQGAGVEPMVDKAASEVSVDDTTSDEPAPTETSDGGLSNCLWPHTC